MKYKSLLLVVSLILSGYLHGGCQTYEVSISNEPFISIVGGKAAIQEAWSDPEFIIPLGFSFQYFDQEVDSLYALDFFAGTYFGTSSVLTSMDIFLAFSTDLIDRGSEIDSSLSPILYKTTGEVGHRVFTLEFRNAGFNSGENQDGIYTDSINLQLKLYEESKNISVHIGSYSTANPGLDFEGFSGPSIGLIQGFDFINDMIHGELLVLAGDPLNPDILIDPFPSNLQWPIPPNTVYTFSPKQTSTEKIVFSQRDSFYYPNPSTGACFLSPERSGDIISPVRIYNSTGQLVLIDSECQEITFNGLPNGMYYLTFQTTDGIGYQCISVIGK